MDNQNQDPLEPRNNDEAVLPAEPTSLDDPVSLSDIVQDPLALQNNDEAVLPTEPTPLDDPAGLPEASQEPSTPEPEAAQTGYIADNPAAGNNLPPAPDEVTTPPATVITSDQPAVNQDDSAKPTGLRSKLPLLIVAGIAAVLIIGGGIYFFGFKSADQPQALAVSNNFVYDITHNNATAAWQLLSSCVSLTIPPAEESDFATNVQNLSDIYSSGPKETSLTTVSQPGSTGKVIPEYDIAYSVNFQPVMGLANPGTINVDVWKANHKWQIVNIGFTETDFTTPNINF